MHFSFFLYFRIDTNAFPDLPILRLEKLQHWIVTPKVSTRMDGVNGERPYTPQYTVVKISGCGLIRLRLVSPHFDHCEDAYRWI